MNKILKKFRIILIAIVAIGMTGCGESNSEKITKHLIKLGYSCRDYLNCTMTENGVTKTISSSYGKTILVVETNEVKYIISDQAYKDDETQIYVEDKPYNQYAFVPKECSNGDHCKIKVGDKVYPEGYEKYNNYKETDDYKEYLRLSRKGELSVSESFDFRILKDKYTFYMEFLDLSKYTDEVNKYMREFESYFDIDGYKNN